MAPDIGSYVIPEPFINEDSAKDYQENQGNNSDCLKSFLRSNARHLVQLNTAEFRQGRFATCRADSGFVINSAELRQYEVD